MKAGAAAGSVNIAQSLLMPLESVGEIPVPDLRNGCVKPLHYSIS